MCLGSHPPEGGVVLGSDLFGLIFFMYFVTTWHVVTYVLSKLLYYFMFKLLLVCWLVNTILYGLFVQ